MPCGACFGTYRSTRAPKSLPCGHTFCGVCLDNMRNGPSIVCPSCKKSHNIQNTESLPIIYALIENEDDVLSTSDIFEESAEGENFAPPLRQLFVKDLNSKSLAFDVTAEDTVGSLKKKICVSICCEDYGSARTAKILHCGHTFCQKCINRLQNNFSVSCPRCKKSHSIQNIESLTTNFDATEADNVKSTSGCHKESAQMNNSAPASALRQLFVKDLQGKSQTIDATAWDTVERLKKKIYAKCGIPETDQRLIFSGHQLEDERTLGSYKIEHGCTVHLVMRLRGGTFGC